MIATLALLLSVQASQAAVDGRFVNAISAVENMVWQPGPQAMASQNGLSLVNVTWEDTGRTKGSVWGPNISDMTIGVRDSEGLLHPMPVFRFDNYTDTTADVRSDRFWLRVGNEDGEELRAASLEDVLRDTRSYLHDPSSWKGPSRSLWNARDEHVLVSAQACFLPIPSHGEATFTPVLYNYQSQPGDPAVLTIVATREGTSVQVVENEGGYLSEVLFFDQDGERAPFTAVRQSDWKAGGGDGVHGSVSAGGEDGLNVVLVIQVPLKQKMERRAYYLGGDEEYDMAAPMAEASKSSGVENAVIGHGPVEGPFTEVHGLAIERDPRYPVRVTVQFYKATADGAVTPEDVRAIREQIDRVYEDGDWVGSLVTSGYAGRPTEWVRPSETAVWADSWWGGLKAR
jgi:hypothetical protein